MTIYFVNKYSKIRSPFEIVDSSNMQIINIGDICIRDIGGILQFLVVKNEKNDWSSCICVYKSNYECIDIEANSLLFAFDNLRKRKGNVILLNKISNVFKKTLVYNFIINAVEILTYKKDQWNVDFLIPIYSSTDTEPLLEENKDNLLNLEQNEGNVLFYSYLSDGMKLRFNTLQSARYSLKEIYQFLRQENEGEFNKAIFKFLHENPKSTIYNRM